MSIRAGSRHLQKASRNGTDTAAEHSGSAILPEFPTIYTKKSRYLFYYGRFKPTGSRFLPKKEAIPPSYTDAQPQCYCKKDSVSTKNRCYMRCGITHRLRQNSTPSVRCSISQTKSGRKQCGHLRDKVKELSLDALFLAVLQDAIDFLESKGRNVLSCTYHAYRYMRTKVQLQGLKELIR